MGQSYRSIPFQYFARHRDHMHLSPAALEQRDRDLEDYLGGIGTWGAQQVGTQAQLLAMSATADSIASGGDYVTFGSIVAQYAFASVSVAGASWAHPIDAVYVLTYEHDWDTYAGGGTIRLEVDGVLVPEGIIADASSGNSGIGTIVYWAAEGSVGRIHVTQSSGSAQTCDAVVRIAVPDPTVSTSTSSVEWEKVYDGDVYDLTSDGTDWWVTNGATTATKIASDWSGTLSSFTAHNAFSRGITWDGASLWICGQHGSDELIRKFSTSGSGSTGMFTGPETDGNTGLAFDGTDLWLVFGDTVNHYLEKWTTAGGTTFVTQTGLGADSHQGAAYYDGRVYVNNTTADTLRVFDLTGTEVGEVDVSAAVAGATGCYIAADGTLYVSKDGDGVYRRNLKIGEL